MHMRGEIWILSLLLFCISPILAPSKAGASEKTTLSISAGVGLKDALYAIQRAYGQQRPEVAIEFNFAASGLLRKQIEQGAPVDLFLAPGRQHLQALLDGGFTDGTHSCALLGNKLVLVVSQEKKRQIGGFADLIEQAETIAIGMPQMVPVGRYAQQTLSHLGLWESLLPRMVYGKSVRQVLAYVDSGNADAGLIFSSDTRLLTSAAVATVAPDNSHAPIIFSMAAMLNSRHPKALADFTAYLQSRQAAAIFASQGFNSLISPE
ncbi:molybdate ABC transporter substrate-binding protein [Syntrophotalea acetylenivorans]|uniref:Molybdate ABC transporter substrate-binding protein n=1 Tax=Syntrophotalea acetylenivorans TaxID=1842532 RepID=A0A1L3GQ22_9BACT|nr:molybdate ABC transporter substrate-binding protein [Syntrophotalea acetylenivorans]APG28046.1 molybdate ABC transporter substrate-binding protein [Syntrophotalea acetylenivorans]